VTDPDDDLHGRQVVLLLLFFGTVAGGLYLLGWLTRPSFFYDNPLVCGAIAGGACFPAHLLVERFEWFRRLGRPRRWEKKRPPGWVADWGPRLLRAVRVVVGLPIAVGSLAILPLGLSSAHDNQQLVADGPVRQAVVVSVDEDKWAKYGALIVKVANPVDGTVVEVDGGNDLEPVPAPGDRIDVVVDPDDPTIVIAAAVDWSTPWWAYPLGIVITIGCLALGVWIAFG
jgi:hypothetical protein